MGIKNITSNKGFTIVELLIVIVVIAILAAITIVSYNGITSQTRQSVMKSELKQVSKLIQNYKVANGAFPSSLGQLNNGQGVNAPSDSEYGYTTSGDNYFLSIKSLKASDQYRISSTTGKIEDGTWPGHDGSVAAFPTRGGYVNLTTSYGSGDTMNVPLGSIPNGAWVIVVFTTYVGSDFPTPSGWTALLPRHTTNTMQTSIFAKMKSPGDPASQEFEAPGSTGINFVNAALIWGQGSADVGSWVLGSFGDRYPGATSSSVITPTITTTSANTLVLSIATERTNADETNYTSLTGAIPWVWIQQPNGNTNKNQTIAIAYNEQGTAGVSQAMTVVYPNAQTYNATAVQIGIPPIY